MCFSFWGVFTINASSREIVQKSYTEIAQRAGIDPKGGNVKHWLPEQTRPWLLIVDNADDHPRSHAPEDFIFESDSGFVLYATRNHLLRTLANCSIKFTGLGGEYFSVSLLSSAGHPRSFAPKVLQLATEICQKFGSLPLAIVHAGKAILKGTCKLEGCLAFVEKKSLARVKGVLREGRSTTMDTTDDSAPTVDATVCTTFEMVVPAAREEALQPLRLLSFVQSQHFPFHILPQAITNPQRQLRGDRKTAKAPKPAGSRRCPTKLVMHGIVRKVYGYLESLGERPALPDLLRNLKDAGEEDASFRLRGVLSDLGKLALIDYIEANHTYCAHSSVTWWIRASMGF